MLSESCLGENTNVIEKIESIFPEEIAEHSVHCLLISCGSIAESEGHDQVFKDTFFGHKCCLGLVVWMHFDLPVPRGTIESREVLRTVEDVEDFLDAGEWIRVFLGALVEWTIIDTYPRLSTFLPDENDRKTPLAFRSANDSCV